MKVIVIDPARDAAEVVETPGGLDEWYRLIHCRIVQLCRRRIGGRYYDIVADEEALYNGPAYVTGIDEAGRPQLIGALAICRNMDGEGLAEEDIKEIMASVGRLQSKKDGTSWPALYGIGI